MLPKSPISILSNLYRESAKFYLNQNKPQMAVKFLEKINNMKGKNAKITSMLINAYSQFDPAKAQRYNISQSSFDVTIFYCFMLACRRNFLQSKKSYLPLILNIWKIRIGH